MTDRRITKWVARASEADGPLGVKPSWPPGKVRVLEVQAGSWGEAEGIRAGDEILFISGASLRVAEMTYDVFAGFMQKRPLELTLGRREITKGTTLVCIGNEEQDRAEIFESMTSSDIVGYVQKGSLVTVLGEPCDIDGYMMVPIEPTGAVQLNLFEHTEVEDNQIPNISRDDVLICIGSEEQDHAEIYESMTSFEIVGKVQTGSTVIASGEPTDVDGYMMVPIMPTGAVQLEFFRPHVSEIAQGREVKPKVKPRAPPARPEASRTYPMRDSTLKYIEAGDGQIQNISRDDVLLCVGNEEQDHAEIFENMTSLEIVGVVQSGNTVIVSGEPMDVDGYMMVPITPAGAVQLEFFRPHVPEIAPDRTIKPRFPPVRREARQRSLMGEQTDERIVSSSVDIGSCLKCVADGWQPVCVFRDIQSPAVIAVLREGDYVIAAGRPVMNGSINVVSVQPSGAVDLAFFRLAALPQQRKVYPPLSPRSAEAFKLIRMNSLLICLPPPNEELGDVFESCHSHTVVDTVRRGDYVVAAGLALEKWGCLMVPIRPRGAIDYRYFRLKSKDALASVVGNVDMPLPFSALVPQTPLSNTCFSPLSPRDAVQLDGALASSRAALAVAVFAGLDANVICATSASIRDAVSRVWRAANETNAECLYLCGGSGNGLQMLDSVERFVWQSGIFDHVSRMLKRRIAPAGAVLGKRLYLCGGCTEESPAERGVEYFDFVTERWAQAPSMHVARVGAAAAAAGGSLCVCGGRDGLMRTMDSTEWLSIDADTWMIGPPMLEHRLNPGAGALGPRLFLCGGSDQFGQTLKSAERFTAGDSSWQTAPHMHTHRRGAATCTTVGALSVYMYVCGGWCGAEALSSAERFNSSLDTWEDLAPMSRPRAYAAAAAVAQYVYVFGGFCEGECLNSVDRFDSLSRQWNSRGIKPMLERRAYAVASPVIGTP